MEKGNLSNWSRRYPVDNKSRLITRMEQPLCRVNAISSTDPFYRSTGSKKSAKSISTNRGFWSSLIAHVPTTVTYRFQHRQNISVPNKQAYI